jgi:Do/DeqQ family serine protease
MAESRRSSRLLLGIGLVLVGLLGGILFMLVFDNDPAAPTATRIVKQASDTSGPTARRAGAPDSGLRSAPSPATLSEQFRSVAERATPAVVSIRVQSGGDGGDGGSPFGGPPRRQNLGSGVIITPDGYVVTNNHVVKGASTIQVQLVDKRRFDARVVGTDSSTDLAVLKIDGASDFPVMAFGNSEQVQVGDWVVAVGNPFRLTSTVTAGIVSALGRQLNIIKDQFRIEDFIQTDAAINPGNSGGALVNLDGQLVGINTAIASGTGGYEGYGFAIPAVLVERIATDLIAHGEVKRGFLGVSIQPMTAEVAEEVGMDDIHGVYVPDVRGGGAAERAGLRGGDIIEAIDGERVNSPGALQSAVALHRPGDVVAVRVWRDGAERTFDVRLMGEDTPAYQNWLSDLQSNRQPGPVPNGDENEGEGSDEGTDSARPDSSETTTTTLDRWGVGVRPLNDQQQSRFGVEAGAYVAFIENGQPAASAGLPRDVVITALDDTPVETPKDVEEYVADAGDDPVLVEVRRPDGTQAFYEID